MGRQGKDSTGEAMKNDFGKCVVKRAVLLLFAMHRFAFCGVGKCGVCHCSGGPARSSCVWQQLKSDWINCIVKL